MSRRRNQTVGNNETDSIDNDLSESVGDNRARTVGNNEQVAIGQNRAMTVGGTHDLTTQGIQRELVGGDSRPPHRRRAPRNTTKCCQSPPTACN